MKRQLFSPSARVRRVALLAMSAHVVAASAARAQTPPSATVPPPVSVLGFTPGEDRKVADWDQIVRYMDTVAAASERVRIDTIGRSTLDRPFVLLTISDPANLERIAELRDIQRRLADPRRIETPEEEADLLRRGRAVVLITAAIHPTEVGSALLPVRLVHRLATSTEADVERILRETVILVIPALNPDGVQMVAEWYRSTVDMPWEGQPPPFLYHHYAGHDANRDWYAITQRETQITVEQVHNTWHPQVVYDVHQQAADGSRFFVPPWTDPVDPNVDPLLLSATNALGTAIAWDLHRAGRTGVVVNATYDAWTPARAYQLYHGGVRILSETAGAKLASPVTVPFDSLKPETGFDPRRRSWNFPEPWRGGRWGLEEILDYMEDGAMAMLRHVAAERAAWLDGFVKVAKRAIAGWDSWPRAWMIRAGPGSEVAVAELTRILLAGGVELQRAEEPFRIDGRDFEPGSLIVSMRQPYAAFAQTLLEARSYPVSPDRRGSDAEPYDVTAHALPLLLGLEAIPVFEEPPRGASVDRAPLVERRARGLSHAPDVLVGLYQPWVPAMDEGWTRWVFDQYAVPYVTLHLQDIRKGDLIRSHTAIVLPSVPADTLARGWPAGSLPARFTGGLEGAGVEELRTFVEEGGTLVALDESSAFVIDELGLPVHDPTDDVDPSEFFSRGSIVRLDVDSALAAEIGMDPTTAAWIQRGHAFVPDSASGTKVLARYGDRDLLLSGLLRGPEHLEGLPAVVEVPLGRGRVVLFGFRPQYRGQSLATYPLLFEVLRR